MSDAWDGLRLVTKGVGEMVKRASFAMSFGALALGGALALTAGTAVGSFPASLLALGAGFSAACLGQEVDERRRRRHAKSAMLVLEKQKRIEKKQLQLEAGRRQEEEEKRSGWQRERAHMEVHSLEMDKMRLEREIAEMKKILDDVQREALKMGALGRK